MLKASICMLNLNIHYIMQVFQDCTYWSVS